MIFGGVFLAVLGIPAANTWRMRSRTSGMIRLVSIPLIAGTAGWLAAGAISVYTMLSLAASWLGVYLITLRFASNKLSPEVMAVRKVMQRARKYFKKELGEPRPAIRDDVCVLVVGHVVVEQLERRRRWRRLVTARRC